MTDTTTEDVQKALAWLQDGAPGASPHHDTAKAVETLISVAEGLLEDSAVGDVDDYQEDSEIWGISVIQPIGGCDGSRLYEYDSESEDGRGRRLSSRCSGCRACS